jgi:hypothetical protein
MPTNFALCYKVTAAAALFGQFEVLRALRRARFIWNSWTCVAAVAGGRMDILEWAHANGCKLSGDVSAMAGAKGRVDMLQWLSDHGCPITFMLVYNAVDAGSVDVLVWAYAFAQKHGVSDFEPFEYEVAAAGGDVPMLCTIARSWKSYWRDPCAIAARLGHLAVLQWAHAQGRSWGKTSYVAALAGGHAALAEWALAHGGEWTRDI